MDSLSIDPNMILLAMSTYVFSSVDQSKERGLKKEPPSREILANSEK